MRVSELLLSFWKVCSPVCNDGATLFTPGEVEVAEFDRVIAINVRGVMLSYKYAAEQMVKQGRGGRIIGEYSTVCLSIRPFSFWGYRRVLRTWKAG